MKFTKSEVASFVRDLFEELILSILFCIVVAIGFLTLPIWIFPYAIYKQFKRGK